MLDTRLTDEAGRLSALHRYGVLDSLKEPNFDSITSIVKELLGVPICAVSLVDADRQWFKSMQGLEISETLRSVAFCDHTIRQRRPLVIEDAASDPRFADNPLVTGPPYIRAYAGAPLTSPDGYNLGSLCAIDRRSRPFGDGDLALLERFAKVVVDQLELRTLAHRDFLTDALTRRAFTDTARTALQQLSSPSTLAVLDVDHFKQVNDRHGHPTGDKVLKEVARVIRMQLRPSDLFGRLGGEEFGILLPATSEEQALPCAERIRAAVAASVAEGCPAVTVSIGLAEIERPEDFDIALAKADAALYAAKRAGRDRCLAAQDLGLFDTAA